MSGSEKEPIDVYLAEQRSGIVRVFNEQAILDLGAIAFSSWEVMQSQLAYRDSEMGFEGSHFTQVGRRSIHNVRGFYDARWDQWQCWVRAGYRSYRPAFLSWLGDRGFVAERGDVAGFDVDHLFSAARAPHGDHVIRLVLVDRGANRSWGSWSEKLDAPRRTKSRNNLRYLHVAKALGLRAPDSIANRLMDPDGFIELSAQLIDAGVREYAGFPLHVEIRDMFMTIERQAIAIADLTTLQSL